MVIGGSAAPEPRRGSLNHGDLFHDIPDDDDDAFRALDLGPQVRPYAVGAPLKAPRALSAGGAAAGTVLVNQGAVTTRIESDRDGHGAGGPNQAVVSKVSTDLGQATLRPGNITTSVTTGPGQATLRQATMATAVSTDQEHASHRPTTVTTSVTTDLGQPTHRPATVITEVSTNQEHASHRPAAAVQSTGGASQSTHRGQGGCDDHHRALQKCGTGEPARWPAGRTAWPRDDGDGQRWPHGRRLT
ncbi:hypothetical protein ONE63_005480 [Megalurothrips usitatus]|uniref:Uncharacterized protein n=1 Tax=Megalurothrips usitatus TaxID=439358 RepID=A0AAV7XZP9_9NEOP|nr:hypothetical protein ONE63_005480 [Megalurothrips usitatus]